PRGPKNFRNIIVLPFIFFHGIKNPSATKWVAIFINKSARGSGIFKILPVFVIKYFWLCGDYGIVLFKFGNYGLQPIFGYFHIAVQQNENIFGKVFQSIVIAFCITAVHFILKNFYSGKKF